MYEFCARTADREWPKAAMDSSGSLTVGALPVNQIVIAAPGVEPIHCLVETRADGRVFITDLGSLSGVRVNGVPVRVEAEIKAGDRIEIGSVQVEMSKVTAPAGEVRPEARATASTGPRARTAGRDPLFSPRRGGGHGRVLEVVAYWGNTVLNVDHFHPDFKGYDTVTIGDPGKAHFLSGGRDFLRSQTLAEVEGDRCVLRLDDDMRASVRHDGAVRKVSGRRHLTLLQNDYAHVEHGPIRYFLHYASPPQVTLPPAKAANPLLKGLGIAGTVLYLALVAVILTVDPKPLPTTPVPPTECTICDPIHVVHIDTFVTRTVSPRPNEPRIVPPPPVKPVPPVSAAAKPPPPVTAKPAVKPAAPKPQQSAAAGLAGTGRPDLKPTGSPGGATKPSPTTQGGPGQVEPARTGGALAGTQAQSQPGVDNPSHKGPSFPDLKKLGAGLGPVFRQAGGTPVQFQSTAGGAGTRTGSATRDLGLGGGPGRGPSMALPGLGGRLNGWGPGDGPGGNGRGGNGPGIDLAGNAFRGGNGPGPGGHGRVEPNVPPQILSPGSAVDPALIQRVIRSHLAEIRHCYELLLQRSPHAAGKVVVGFTIDTAAHATGARVTSATLNDQVFQGCLLGKVGRWNFPGVVITTPVQVTYPFIFTPDN